MEKLVYLNNCVNWHPDDVHSEGGLCDMIAEAVQVTRDTFLRHVDRESREDLERRLGYAPHDPNAVLTMRRDGCVSYWRSKLHERTVYYVNWSAIEHVFVPRSMVA